MLYLQKRAPGTLFGLVALVLLGAGGPPALIAQTTAPKAKLTLRPVTRDDISAYKLPSTTQTTGGLSTIGIGQPAHLDVLVEAAVPAADVSVTWNLTRSPSGSKAVIADSILPESVPIYEPADRADYRLVARKFLRPDVAGVYTLTATIETKGRPAVNFTQTITAGTYVGSLQCVGCHNGGASRPWSMYGSWASTTHAKIFKEGVDGVASDHYGAGCIACHTVGYDADPLAKNGGFDDLAAEYKWTVPAVASQKPGTFDALPDALKNVANIQCENCHGPGSRHVQSGGDARLISKTSDSGVCATCHAALTHHSKSGQWNSSVHAVTTREAAGAGREGCVGCHTGNGFMDKIKGKKEVSTTYSAISCQTCHEAHGESRPREAGALVRIADTVTLRDGTEVRHGGKGALCMNCHQARQNAAVYAETTAASARFGPHHSPQADMLAGVNGYTYGKTIPTSAHGEVVEETCVACHMQMTEDSDPELTKVGGHTFKVATEGKQLVTACQNCHGKRITTFNFELLDYDNDGKVEGVQTEVQHLLDKLASMLPPVGQPKETLTINTNWTRAQLKAAYNWQFVAWDGSRGVHNMAYAIGLLKASIADLESQK